MLESLGYGCKSLPCQGMMQGIDSNVRISVVGVFWGVLQVHSTASCHTAVSCKTITKAISILAETQKEYLTEYHVQLK